MLEDTIPASVAEVKTSTLDIDLFGKELPGADFGAALASASTVRTDKDVIYGLSLK